jgi:hypothetical protein
MAICSGFERCRFWLPLRPLRGCAEAALTGSPPDGETGGAWS